MFRWPLALASLALIANPGFAQSSTAQSVTLSQEELLRPYYAALAQQLALPVASEGAELASNRIITRLAFGSCNHQDRSQHMWAQIAATKPDLFLFIGDNNYGDQGWTGDLALTTLREAYAKQAVEPELTKFRANIPMMVTWDDHDFGFNDGGASFAPREWAETLFETFWRSSDAVKSRPGIYDSRRFGEDGKITQVIVLDTRFFRSDLDRVPYQRPWPPLGPYVASQDPARTMLGDQQWQWLEAELAKPADLRIIASSIQVLTDAHNYESWDNLPFERDRLYRMLAGREDSGLVLLSGDRHGGGIYSDAPKSAGGEQLWELTSSSLNLAFNSTENNTRREPDPKRLTDFISEENFGLVEIDWGARTFTLSMRGNQGEVRVTRTITWE